MTQKAAKKTDIVIDARGMALGRLASQVAVLIRGKGTSDWEGRLAPSQKVIVKNAGQIRLSGRKWDQEGNERYSGFHSGLRIPTYRQIFTKDPARLIREAVTGMIPRNRLRKDILKNLIIYVTDEK
ncbi:MAG: 50S ribosomal protein L13 [Patescibacteria group bacterium]